MNSIDVTKIKIGHGSHSKPPSIGDDTKVCALEWVSILAGEEKFSDNPQCACPVIASFVRTWNDGFGSTAKGDEGREEFLRPIIPLLLNTRVKSDKVLLRRSFLALDWTIRTYAPAFLRVAKLNEQAAKIANFGEIDSLEQLKAVSADMSAAESAAYSAARSAAYSAARSAAYSAAESAAYSAARSAARSAAYSAAESAARSAAESAAYSAARSAAYSAAESAARIAARSAAYSAAESAAYSAARSAARSAAYSAAESALAPTVRELQLSAQELVKRMVAVTEESVAGWDWTTGAAK